jgi:hypothetical protein
MEEMKADILRRVEEPSDSEEEVVDIFGFAGDRAKGKGKVRVVAFDDEVDNISGVRIAGDGEESSADDEDEGEGCGTEHRKYARTCIHVEPEGIRARRRHAEVQRTRSATCADRYALHIRR